MAAKDRLDASERERQRTLDAERALSEANALVETLRIERDRLREAHACGEASSSSSTETREKLEGQLDQALRALRAAEGRLCEADATVDALRAEMVQLRASATKDRAAARDAAESLRRARLDLDRAVAARKDAEADAASSRADADDARKASEADRRACMALEAKCRELGASDVDVAAARVPRRTVPEAIRAHRGSRSGLCLGRAAGPRQRHERRSRRARGPGLNVGSPGSGPSSHYKRTDSAFPDSTSTRMAPISTSTAPSASRIYTSASSPLTEAGV